VVSVPAYGGRQAHSPDGDFRRSVYAIVRRASAGAERSGGMVARESEASDWKSVTSQLDPRKSPASYYSVAQRGAIQGYSFIRVNP